MTVKELKEALKDLDENYQLEILNQINGKELYLYSIVEDPYSNTVSIFLNEYVDL